MCKRARSFSKKKLQIVFFSSKFKISNLKFTKNVVLLSCQLCACMKLLLILLSSVMTFTVETKSSVKVEGTFPYGMDANYACTYQKGDVREGDTATLTLSRREGIQLEKIQVYLRSNKSSGAGVITMTADGQQLYRKEGTYQEWFGAYDNTNYQPIGWTGKKTLMEGTLEIQVVGTTNSLHIEKYEITYSQAEIQTYTVRLMKGDEEIQQLTGETVELPQLNDENNWHHIAWTETPVHQQSTCPENVMPGVYKPTQNVTLYAVYIYHPTIPEYMTEVQSGVYLYVHSAYSVALTGSPQNGIMESALIDMDDANQYYEIDFVGTDTAFIRNEEGYIGYSGKQVAAIQTPWQVYHSGDITVFYTMYNNEPYVLWPYLTDGHGDYIGAGLVAANPSSASHVHLQIPVTSEEPAYTCYPQYGLGIENVEIERTNECIIPFGVYNLIIKDGKKYLRLR